MRKKLKKNSESDNKSITNLKNSIKNNTHLIWMKLKNNLFTR